jgi:glutamyl-tRNA synthetase
MYGGKLVLRYDDTNPEDTRLEYWAAIKVGLDWLGIEFDEIKNTSDDIGLFYDKCVEMIKKNYAYVCTCKRDTISKNRKEMVSCECSMGDVKQNEERWERMFKKYKPGEAVVRFRGDMESKNTVMRDPVLFRINDARHAQLAEEHRVWPSYDIAVAVEDSTDGITHALRSKEYELRNELYHAILDALDMRHPKMLEFSRLEFKGMPVSKRILRPLIDEGKVSSYDDPRLPTLAALERRGITPEAIRKFTLSLSLTKADTLAPFDSLEAFNRKIVDENSIRLFMVKDPKTLTIRNLPNSTVELPNHPSNKMGTRKVTVEDSVFLSSDDVKSLKIGDQLRLMGLGNVKITSVNSEITGEFTGDERDVNFMKLQWVSQKNAHELKILIPQRLFVDDKFNEESLEEIHVYVEPHYLELRNGEEIQFVRFGYCRKDSSKQAIFTHK